MTKSVDELMRLADAVADAGTQMLPAVEIARRLAALRSALEEVVAENVRLIEDRARFPDRPDDIGRMIGSRFKNLEAVAKSNEDAWRRAMATAERYARDSERLDWVVRKVSGKEWRRVGVSYPAIELIRSAIDAAMQQAPEQEG